MLEQEFKKETAQETQKSEDVVRQSAEEYLKERIGESFMADTQKKGIGLDGFKTCELVEELKKREGVEEVWAEPYENKKILVNGPAVVLIITD